MTYNPYGEPTFDYAASLASLVKDVVRLKALCRTAWTYYRRIQDDATFAKIWILLWCAPQKVCRDLISVDIVSKVTVTFNNTLALSVESHENL